MRTRSIKTLTHAAASRAIEAMVASLTERGRVAVVAVADAHGDLLALARMDGAPASSVRIASHKAWTAASEGVSSRAIGERVRSEERLDIAYYGEPRVCGWGGGLPVRIDGELVGAVGVSGLPEHEDELIAEIGVKAIVAL
jgi:glc operon protein GlcG